MGRARSIAAVLRRCSNPCCAREGLNNRRHPREGGDPVSLLLVPRMKTLGPRLRGDDGNVSIRAGNAPASVAPTNRRLATCAGTP
ncbi:hypothetical protein FQY83_10805 [Luteimonas marina]|uniref:Uncharacterized protein n=1 Tax=Luteimonas marina TaxID=488485 RepID=A0A5C5U1A6_9GAMM|nr:hypothetical protein FQY83_10805 [Luteimonas marina]